MGQERCVLFSTGYMTNQGVIQWGGSGDFLWDNALNWSTDLLPDATNDVGISISGTDTVTLDGSNGPYLINSLASDEAIVLKRNRASFSFTCDWVPVGPELE